MDPTARFGSSHAETLLNYQLSTRIEPLEIARDREC
jgi:hypothetical protein